MLKNNQIDLVEISKTLNKLLLVGFLLSLLVTVVLSLVTYNLASSQSRTLVPPMIKKSFTISNGSMDKNYAAMMGEYIVNLKLNVTPASVERKFGLLLDYVSNDSWNNIQPQLMREATVIKDGNISSDFDITEIKVSEDNSIVKFTGILNKYVGSRALEPIKRNYFVYLNYEDGQVSFSQIKKGDL